MMMPKVNLIACIGKHGQLGLEGSIPFERNDKDLVRHLVQWDIPIVGGSSADQFKWLRPKSVFHFNRSRTAHEFRESYRKRYYDKEFWILGGAITYREWAPYVNGRVILSVVDYDGFADTWFPFEEYGMCEVAPSAKKLKKIAWDKGRESVRHDGSQAQVTVG
jgi:hypothetical protein